MESVQDAQPHRTGEENWVQICHGFAAALLWSDTVIAIAVVANTTEGINNQSNGEVPSYTRTSDSE